VLEIGAGPSDHGICKLVLAALDKRLIYSDGQSRMKMFNVVTAAPSRHVAHEKSTNARKQLLWKIAKDGAKTGERKIELHRVSAFKHITFCYAACRSNQLIVAAMYDLCMLCSD
jgi:hypothetical protein